MKRYVIILLVSIGSLTTKGQDNILIDSTQKDSAIFERVEIDASYPGGDEAWRRFLQTNLRSSTPIKNGAIAGRYTVYVQFIVTKDGSVADVKPLTHHGYGMEEEVVRIINKTGKWSPAQQKGRFVNAYRKQPVTFIVQDDNIEIDSKYPFLLLANEDNEVKIYANKVKPEDITITVSGCTVKALGDGRFSVKTRKPGKAIMVVYGKNGNTISTINYEIVE